MEGISIRNMVDSDREAVARLVFQGFWQKFLPLQNMKMTDAVDLIDSFIFSDPSIYERTYVAVDETQVCGMMMMKRHGDETAYEVSDMKKLLKIGLRNLFKTVVLLAKMDYKVKEGNLYIETIAVDELYRGQGVGTMLLELADKLANQDASIKALCLHVIAKNEGARKLYSHRGFTTKRSSRNSVLKKYADINRMFYMVKSK